MSYFLHSQEKTSCLGKYLNSPKVWQYTNIEFARIPSVFMMIWCTKYNFIKSVGGAKPRRPKEARLLHLHASRSSQDPCIPSRSLHTHSIKVCKNPTSHTHTWNGCLRPCSHCAPRICLGASDPSRNQLSAPQVTLVSGLDLWLLKYLVIYLCHQLDWLSIS